jgi:hypothetical protein
MPSAIQTYLPAMQPGYSPMPGSVQPGMQPVYVQQVGGDWTVKEMIVVSLLGAAVLGTAVYFGRKFILNNRANKEENQSMQEGSSATYAKQIKMAFENDGWPGTNTTALRSALREIPSKDEFNKVVKSYQRLYAKNMLKDMQSELQSTEYNEMVEIINGKPQKKGQVIPAVAYNAWAKRLKAAFDKTYGFLPGTDTDAIVAVFNEIPSQRAYVQVAIAYQRLYGQKLSEALSSESEFGQYADWMKIITSKPQ